jgi:EAL and modified HD-GYP domain-containing signal transduction protein
MASTTTKISIAQKSESAPKEWTGEMRYVARHPILNVRGHVQGYELLFQMNPDEAMGESGVHAARTILDDAVLYGLDRFTGGAKAFVSCTAETLDRHLVDVLPARNTVLQLPESMQMDPRLVNICANLKDSGFSLALLDFNWEMTPHPLLYMADYLKVDFGRFDATERKYILKRAGNARLKLIADKIETQEDYRQACAEKFTLFQGYYFCHPVLIQNAKVPANRAFHFEILRELNNDPLDLHKVSLLVMRDAALVYRLLRLVNSPVYALYQEITSVESAIMVVGESAFRRIATLAILSELSASQPPEILHMSLVRARFCELAAPFSNLNPDEQYLLGMFSLLPAMLRHPMESFAPDLPLRNEIRQALLGMENPERALLAWIEAHERNDQLTEYAVVESYGLDQQRLIQFYIDAILWDETILRNEKQCATA